MIDVPCNGCTRCCRGDAVRLMPDEYAHFESVPHDRLNGERMLAHTSNGDCIYLGEKGCTIHTIKPYMCRTMDCRLIGRRFTFTQARKLAKKGLIKYDVWLKGKQLMKKAKGER